MYRPLTLLPVFLLGLALGMANTSPATAAATERVAGSDRYATAAELAAAAFPEGSTGVILSRGDEFADALAASALVGTQDAPVLLTRSHRVPQVTSTALDDLNAERVLIVGGAAAVGPGVASHLRDNGYRVARVAGSDRYDTAAAIARRSGSAGWNGQRIAFLARGDLPADALAAGPVAANGPHPMLLTRPGRLPQVTAEALQDSGVERVFILGGRGAIRFRVAQAVRDLGIETRRLGGTDRAHTAERINRWANRGGALKPQAAMLTRPDVFADAVASSAYGAVADAPLLFTHSTDALAYPSEQFLVDHSHLVERVVALGGADAVADNVVVVASSAADPPQRTIRYSVNRLGNPQSDFAYFRRHADRTLTDIRGWSLHHDARYDQVDSGGEFTLHLATPQQVADAAPGCSAQYSCRVGNDVYINDARWRQATDTYSDRSLSDYRHYVVTHEVGHWLELDHRSCPGRSQPAPVMQQQSISLDGCTTNIWPLADELDEARNHLFGAGTAEADDDVVVE